MATTITKATLANRLELDVQNSESLTRFLKSWDDELSENFKVSSSFVFDRVLSSQSASLSSAANLDIDMYDLGTLDIGNGAGRDNLGMSHANATIHYLYIRNQSGSDGVLTLNTSISNGWTTFQPSGSTTLGAGEWLQFYWPVGKAVTDTSDHLLRLTATGGDCTYDFEFLGKTVV